MLIFMVTMVIGMWPIESCVTNCCHHGFSVQFTGFRAYLQEATEVKTAGKVSI